MKKILLLSLLCATNAFAMVGDSRPDVPMGGDHLFPQGMNTYDEGTKVVHNDRLFECKAFPNSGFCKQWSPSATQYEPGVGFASDSAWIDITPPAAADATFDYDFVFPRHQAFYKAGVIVAQDGIAYQCKAAPFDGFCKQGNFGSTEYDPGQGHAWTQAWTELGPIGQQR